MFTTTLSQEEICVSAFLRHFHGKPARSQNVPGAKQHPPDIIISYRPHGLVAWEGRRGYGRTPTSPHVHLSQECIRFPDEQLAASHCFAVTVMSTNDVPCKVPMSTVGLRTRKCPRGVQTRRPFPGPSLTTRHLKTDVADITYLLYHQVLLD